MKLEIKQGNLFQISTGILLFNSHYSHNHSKRQNIINSNNKKNKLEEDNFLDARKNKSLKNPWAKVIENIELKESNYSGSKDVNRMRDILLRRKHDYDKGNAKEFKMSN